MLTEVKEGSALTGPVTSAYSYDAAGRRRSRTDSGGGLSRTSGSDYDTAGRLSRTVDAGGLVTEYLYSADGLTTTVILPGGATETTERFRDGQIKSVTGTAGPARYYSYGANGDGSRWTLIHFGAADSPSWEKTFVDMLGRTIRSERSGPRGKEGSLSFYDQQGRLEKSTAPVSMVVAKCTKSGLEKCTTL